MFFGSPILLFAQYSYEEYVDGSQVPVCLTQATSFWAFTFFLMTISVFFLLPLIILVILYAIIARNLITSDTKLKLRLSKPEFSVKARKQVVLMLGAVVLSFFTCLLPFRVLTLWIIFVPEETFQSLNMETYYNLLYFCRIMWYLNSAVNPILYNLMSSKFRKGFFKLCRCWLIVRNRHNINGRARAATFNTTSSYLTNSCCQYHHHHHCHDISESNCDAAASTKKTLSLDDLRNMHTIVTQTKTNIPRIITSSSATNLNKIVHTLPRHNKHHSIYNNGMKKNYAATSCCCCCCTCPCSSENYDEHHQQKEQQQKPCSYRTAVVVCRTCNTGNGALPATTTSSSLLKNHIKENDLRKLAFKNSSVKRKARNVSFDETAIYANNQRNDKNIKIQYKKQISLDEHLLRKKIMNNGLNLNLVETNNGENKVQCKYSELQYVVKYIDETSHDETPQSFAPLLNSSDV